MQLWTQKTVVPAAAASNIQEQSSKIYLHHPASDSFECDTT